MRSSSGGFHLEITLHPNKHLSFLTLLLLQGIYTHTDDCTMHLEIQKQIRLQISWTGAWKLRRYFWPCFFPLYKFRVLVLVVFCLNLWDGSVKLDRYLEVGHCTNLWSIVSFCRTCGQVLLGSFNLQWSCGQAVGSWPLHRWHIL